MNSKPRLSDSLQRLLKRDEEQSAVDWLAWFSSPLARKGHLTLTRGGEESYTSLPLTVRQEEDGLVLVVDTLLPTPDEAFWHEPVTLHGRLVTFDTGVEEIVTFSASVGERIDREGRPAVELRQLLDLERQTREFVAELGREHDVELGMIWFDEWIQTKPNRISITRLFFDEPLDQDLPEDGYAVPKATLRLETDGPEVPIRLQIQRGRGRGYEAQIEKIDGVAKQQLTSIVEEIWRVASGLSKRRSASEKEVGYRTQEHDALASAFVPRFVLLGQDKRWQELLGELGEVASLTSTDLEQVSELITETRTDLILGDADLWGSDSIRVERLMRSVSRLRDIPRIWIANNPEQIALEQQSDGEVRDLVDYGAYDLLPRDTDEGEALHRLRWAMGGDALGEGTTALLVSADSRMRYRLALGVASPSLRLVAFTRREGLIPTLEKRKPKWVLLDANSFEVEVDEMLKVVLGWAGTTRAKVLILSRGASQQRVTGWMKRGASDIVLIDPSLRQTVERLQSRLYGAL